MTSPPNPLSETARGRGRLKCLAPPAAAKTVKSRAARLSATFIGDATLAAAIGIAVALAIRRRRAFIADALDARTTVGVAVALAIGGRRAFVADALDAIATIGVGVAFAAAQRAFVGIALTAATIRTAVALAIRCGRALVADARDARTAI